jgi:hypothetical protein
MAPERFRLPVNFTLTDQGAFMPRKKLRTNGSSICSHVVSIKKVKSMPLEDLVEVVDLRVTTTDGNFNYEIRKDVRFPDLNFVKDQIDTLLQKAKSEFLNVEMSEDSKRFYLSFNVQKIGQFRYTGHRI